MSRPAVEQHMRVVVCRWCGCNVTECGGTCVSVTEGLIEVDMALKESDLENPNRVTHLKPIARGRKQTSRNVFQWPEWKALAARLGITDRPLRRVVVTLDISEVATVQETYLVCQQPPADMSRTDTAGAGQSEGSPAHSEDTTATGHD